MRVDFKLDFKVKVEVKASFVCLIFLNGELRLCWEKYQPFKDLTNEVVLFSVINGSNCKLENKRVKIYFERVKIHRIASNLIPKIVRTSLIQTGFPPCIRQAQPKSPTPARDSRPASAKSHASPRRLINISTSV